MKIWYTIFIATFITTYAILSLVLLGGWVVERARALRESSLRGELGVLGRGMRVASM